MALINDDRLGLDTRGFATWLLGRPEGWEIRSGALPRLLSSQVEPVGRDKTRRFLRELEAAGYLTRTRWRDASGRWTWSYCFRPTPEPAKAKGATIDGLAVDGSAVGGSAVDGKPVDIPHTLISSRSDQYILKATTTTPGPDPATPVVVNDGLKIRFPECLKGNLASAEKLISRCPELDAQAVLDELGAMVAQGVVRHPMGLLKRLVERAIAGEFAPNRSVDRRHARTQSAGSAARQSTTQSRPEQPAKPQSASEVATRVLSRLRSNTDP